MLQKNRLHDSKDEIESGVNPKPKLKKSSKPKQTAKACSKADKWQDNSTEVELPNISEKLSQFQNNLSSRDWDIIAGPKLPVWIGSIALILAGFYLMKYSIQQNLLSPLDRVMLGY